LKGRSAERGRERGRSSPYCRKYIALTKIPGSPKKKKKNPKQKEDIGGKTLMKDNRGDTWNQYGLPP